MSSVSGGGVGGNIGGTMNPTPNDVDATAWAEVNKASLGIVRDSIAQGIPISQVIPHYVFGYLHGQGYKASSGRAVLDHPLDTVRMSQLSDQSQGTSWQPAYDQLVAKLPPDLLQQFKAEKNKPFDQRNPSFVAADNVFTATAKALTQLHNVSQPTSMNPLDDVRTQMSLMLPFAALFGSISQGSELTQLSQNFLQEEGANHPNFDAINNLSSQMQSALQLLQQVGTGSQQAFKEGAPGQLDDNTQEIAAMAAKILASLNDQMASVDFGPDLKILQSFTNAMALVSMALALPNTASGSFFLGLNAAMIGIDATKENAAGLVGPHLSLLIDNLCRGIIAGTMPSKQQAGSAFLAVGVKASLLALITLSALTAGGGLGPLPPGSSKDTANTQFFAFETALQMGVNAGIVKSFYESLISASGGNAQAVNLGGSALAELAHFLMILSGANTNNDRSASLVEQVASHLNEGIANADTLNQEAVEGNKNAAVAIKQASVALNHQDFNGFLDVMNGWMESLGSSIGGLQQDLASLNSTVKSVISVTKSLGDNEPLTGSVNVV